MKFANRGSTIALILAFLTGCGSAEVEQMTGSGPPPLWPELVTFNAGPLMSVGYPAERGAWDAVKKGLQAPEFNDALTALEKCELPSGYGEKGPAREAAVKAWREAIQAAGAGSQDELKAKVEAANAAMSALQARN